ncbi:MAG: AAA family ATPase [Planctomycetaceae bacterium]
MRASSASPNSGLVEALRLPGLYGPGIAAVEVIETHISHLFLAGAYVYKLKKSVEFGFLDYSTLDKRRTACEAEIQINRRLAPDVYLGVVAIGRDAQGQWKIGPDVQAEDWLVWMKRLPAELCLSERIQPSAQANPHDVMLVANLLSEFYRSLSPVYVDDYCDRFLNRVIDNRDELQSPQHHLPHALVSSVTAAQLQFLFLNRDSVQRRVSQGHVVEGHGDLRAEHIYMTDPPVVIDGVEFSFDLRTVDTADELCFFEMSCDLLGARDFGLQVTTQVLQSLGDEPEESLLNFYRAYRACVRAKVAALRSDQAAAPDVARGEPAAIQHLKLAAQYCQSLSQRFAIVVRGLSGSGKSTLAKEIARCTGASWLSTDQVRKQSTSSESVVDYSESSRRAVYGALLDQAIEQSDRGASLVLDGTYQDQNLLTEAVSRLERAGLRVCVVTCVCPANVALQRIRARQKEPSLSDADEAVYGQQAAAAQRSSVTAPGTEIDTTQPRPKQLEQLRAALVATA